MRKMTTNRSIVIFLLLVLLAAQAASAEIIAVNKGSVHDFYTEGMLSIYGTPVQCVIDNCTSYYSVITNKSDDIMTVINNTAMTWSAWMEKWYGSFDVDSRFLCYKPYLLLVNMTHLETGMSTNLTERFYVDCGNIITVVPTTANVFLGEADKQLFAITVTNPLNYTVNYKLEYSEPSGFIANELRTDFKDSLDLAPGEHKDFTMTINLASRTGAYPVTFTAIDQTTKPGPVRYAAVGTVNVLSESLFEFGMAQAVVLGVLAALILFMFWSTTAPKAAIKEKPRKRAKRARKKR